MQVAHQPHKQYATLWHAVTHGTMAQSSRLERLCTAPDPGQTLGTLGNSARSLQLALDFLGIQIGRFGDLQSLRLQCHKAMEHIWKHYETTLKQQRAIDSWYLLKHNDTIYIIILLSGILTPCAMCLMCLIGRLQLVSIAWTQAKWWKTTWGTLCAKSESDRIWPNVYI